HHHVLPRDGAVPRRRLQLGGQRLGRLRRRDGGAVPVGDPGGPARVPAVQEGLAAHARHGDRGGQANACRARGAEDRTRPGPADARAGRGGEGVVARGRTPEMIRAEIEATRQELAFSVNDLRSKVTELTNWRGQLIRNRRTALIGAAVAGFVIGGGVAATVSLITGRR